MTYTKETTYERVANKLLSKQRNKKQTFGMLYQGKFLTGTKSKHRTPVSRNWRLFWRLKQSKGLSISNVCNDKQYTDIV